jgi:hypothetical protein
LPVSTSIGCAPTAAAACRSRRRVADGRHAGQVGVEARGDFACSMPGLGLRQSQLSALVCGQKKIASMRPPTWASAFSILSWIAISVSVSNRPRPTPDWLLATTTR